LGFGILSLPSRTVALLEALVATLIWASSFILVKVGLRSMEPFTLAGLRYFLGFVILLPLVARRGPASLALPGRTWLLLAAIGLSAYTLGNGALFWSLQYVSATTSSFLVGLNPLLVLLAGILWLKERPTRWQVIGTIVTLCGLALFFLPGLQPGEMIGLALTGVALVGFALFAILGRYVARDRRANTLVLTAVPLAVGGSALLLIAFPLEGWPAAPPSTWLIVFWLALVNTALAYVLYNHSLQLLTALEMNVLLNLSPLFTAVMAWLWLDESLKVEQLAGMVVLVVGVIAVQQSRTVKE
jgi:drug/metabolite transporter (DMT)-like permease